MRPIDPKVITRKDVHIIAQQLLQDRLSDVQEDLHTFYDRNKQLENELAQAYTCNNVKLLEVVMEHLLFHWDDIVDILMDELIEDEVKERNKIEQQIMMEDGESYEERQEIPLKERKQERVEREVERKREIDIRDIMRIFEEYKRTEESITNRM